MSVIDRRQKIMQAPRIVILDSQPSVANLDSDDEFFCAPEEFEESDRDTNFSSMMQSKASSHLQPTKALRINVESDYDLHDRYMSSEEEPSPSPDSETASQYAEDEPSEPVRDAQDSVDDKENQEPVDAPFEVSIPEIALAVPIMSIGRPKLVDITNLAPMHKRKRSSTDRLILSRAATTSPVTRLRERWSEQKAPEPVIGHDHDCQSESSYATSEEPLPVPSLQVSSETNQEAAAAADASDLQSAQSIMANATRPRLMPRDSMNVLRRRQGSVARARKQISRCASKEGLTSSSSSSSAAEKPVNKRVRRMQARDANERLGVPVIPV